MTESATPAINQYIGTGAVAAYPFTFRTFSSADLQIWEQETGASPAQKTVGVDYTVTGAGSYTGGTVTRTAGNLPSGTRLTIKRVLTFSQSTDLRNQGEYLAETQETALDKLTMLAKQMDEKLGRAIVAPDTDPAIGQMPSASERALKNLFFDASGNPTMGTSISTGEVSLVMQPVVTAASLAAGRTALMSGSVMDPVVNAATLALARSAMGPWGDALVTSSGGSSVARSLASRFRDCLNVRDFGAIGDGSADDTAAIQLAINTTTTIYADAVTLYFPPGRYNLHSALSVGSPTAKGCVFKGAGPDSTRLVFLHSGPQGIVADFSASDGKFFGIEDILLDARYTGFETKETLKVVGSSYCNINNISLTTNGIGIFLYNCPGANVTNCVLEGSVNTLLKVQAGNFRINNVFAKLVGTDCLGPCFWVGGGGYTTGQITNSCFAGGGTTKQWASSAISSTPSDFTITTSVNHGLSVVGEPIVVSGATPSAYNGLWIVSAIPAANQLSVTSAINPGAASVPGLIRGSRVCMLMDTESGGGFAEAVVSNLLLEGIGQNTPGSISLMLNGAGNANFIQGVNFSNLYCDFGEIGIFLRGRTTTGEHTIARCAFNNIQIMSLAYGVYCDTVQGCMFSGIQTFSPLDRNNGNNTDTLDNRAGFKLVGPCQGITVSNSYLGCEGTFSTVNYTARTHKYGIDLGSGCNEFVCHGNVIYGQTLAVKYVAADLATKRMAIHNNELYTGSYPFTDEAVLPSVAAAATVDIGLADVVNITGAAVSITSVIPKWIGRKARLINSANASPFFNTGVDFPVTLNRSQYTSSEIVWDGTRWCWG